MCGSAFQVGLIVGCHSLCHCMMALLYLQWVIAPSNSEVNSSAVASMHTCNIFIAIVL